MTGTRASTSTFHHFFPKMESPFAAALAPADDNNPMYSKARRSPTSSRSSISAGRSPIRRGWRASAAHQGDDRALARELGFDRGRDRRRSRMAAQPAPEEPVRERPGQRRADRRLARRARPGGASDRRQEAGAALALRQGLQPGPCLRRAAAIRHRALDHWSGGAALSRGRPGHDVGGLGADGRGLRRQFRHFAVWFN